MLSKTRDRIFLTWNAPSRLLFVNTSNLLQAFIALGQCPGGICEEGCSHQFSPCSLHVA